MNLPLIIAGCRHALFAHICRLSLQTPAHSALQVCINTFKDQRQSGSQGHPRQMWSDQIDDFGSSCQRRLRNCSGPDNLEIAMTLRWSCTSVVSNLLRFSYAILCRRIIFKTMLCSFSPTKVTDLQLKY